jgi:hypothetical protein
MAVPRPTTRREPTKHRGRRLRYPPGGRKVSVMRQRSAAPLRLAGRDSKRQVRTAFNVRSTRPTTRVPCRTLSFVTLPEALTVASNTILVFFVTPSPCGISPATFLRVRPPAQWNPALTRTAGGAAGFTLGCGAAARGAAARGAAVRGAAACGAAVRGAVTSRPAAGAVAGTLPSREVSADENAPDPPPAIASVAGSEESAGESSTGPVGGATGRSVRWG